MYIGNDLQVAESGNKIIDDISSSFNGSTTSFALTVGGYAPVPFPINTQQIYISVNGVLQEPDPTGSAGFKLLGSNIVFSSAPASGHAFFGVILSGADYVTVGTEFPAGSATSPSITFGTDNNTGLYSVTSGQMGFTSDGVQTFTLDGDAFRFNDNKKLLCGTSGDLEIYHSGSSSFIAEVGTGSLKITTNGSGVDIQKDSSETLARFIVDGSVELYEDNTKRFETSSTGTNTIGIHVDDGATHDGDVTFTGASANVTWDKSADDLIFSDNAKAVFGTGGDLEIFHNGSTSTIKDAGTGNLNFQASHFDFINAAGNEYSARFYNDGSSELYHNGIRTLATNASGAAVLGPEGGSGVLEISADEADDNADIWRLSASASASELYTQNYASGSWETNIKAIGNGGVELYTDNTKRFETLSVGASITGSLGINTNSPTSFNANADELVIHNGSGNCGMTISSPNDAIGRIAFGDPEDNNIGEFKYEHSSNSLQFVANASESMRIDSSGRVLIASTASRTIWGANPKVQIESTDSNAAFTVIRNQASTAGPWIALAKSRGSANGAVTIVQDGDSLGSINWFGADGVDLSNTSAEIRAEIDGTPGSDDVPGRIIFKTTADGAASPTERMRIDTKGRVGLQGAATYGVLEVRASGGAADQLTAVFGADEGQAAGALTDDTDKAARIGIYHYDVDAKPFTFLVASGTTSANTLNIGGGTSLMNGATEIRLSTDSGTTNNGGTERMRIHAGGIVTVGNDASGAASWGGQMVVGTTTGGILRVGDTGSGEKLYLEGGSGVGRIGTESNHQLNFITNGTSNTRMAINTSGSVLIGDYTDTAPDGFASLLQINSANHTGGICIGRHTANANGPILIFQKSRSGSATPGSGSVSEDDSLGVIRWFGSDGTDRNSSAAQIACHVDDTPGDNDLPGRIGFFTTLDGNSSSTEQLRITSHGTLIGTGGGSTNYTNYDSETASMPKWVQGDGTNNKAADAWTNVLNVGTSHPTWDLFSVKGSTNFGLWCEVTCYFSQITSGTFGRQRVYYRIQRNGNASFGTTVEDPYDKVGNNNDKFIPTISTSGSGSSQRATFSIQGQNLTNYCQCVFHIRWVAGDNCVEPIFNY